MRVIKLSSIDEDMGSRRDVDEYFRTKLPKMSPPGKFEIRQRWIASDGIKTGEQIVFSYQGEIVFLARAMSERQLNTGHNAGRYPHYFEIDLASIVTAKGRLQDLEEALSKRGLHKGRLVQSRGWPRVECDENKRGILEDILRQFAEAPLFTEATYIEGERKASSSTVRNANLRIAAKILWGLRCYCCGFDFEQFYGSIAEGCAIVHHLDTFAASEASRISTVEDVRVVCANCHYVIHRTPAPIPVDDLRKDVEKNWNRWNEFGVTKKKASEHAGRSEAL